MIELSVKKKLGNFLLDTELVGSGLICLSGKNGSGKTSLLNCMAGVYAIDSGWIRVNGYDIANLPIEKRGAVLVSYNSFIPHLTVEEHLSFGLRFRKVKEDSSTLQLVASKLHINPKLELRQLSLGNRSKVALLTALVAFPRLILIDELFSNLDNKEEFMEEYKEIAKSNSLDVIYTTQHNEDAKLADYHYVMENGKAKKVF